MAENIIAPVLIGRGERSHEFQFKCLSCGKEYCATSKHNKGYCSRECRAKIKRICIVCGKEFHSQSDRTHISYCSDVCRRKANPDRHRRFKHQCRKCGNDFYGNKQQRYCSLTCRPVAVRHENERICQRCGARYYGKTTATLCNVCKTCKLGSYTKVSFKTCIKCNKDYVARNNHPSKTGTCKQCLDDRKKANNTYQCVVCGKTMEIAEGLGAPRKTCSDQCLKESQRAHGKKGRRIRRQHFGENKKENVISIKVFERDNWICHICGKKTLKTKIGSCDHPKSPTLDHIIPVSRGGSHTYDNIKCACRSCNNKKGNRNHGQQILPGLGYLYV